MSRIQKKQFALLAIVLPLIGVMLFFLMGPGAELYYSLMHWVLTEQRTFHKSMTGSLSAMADNSSLTTAYAVVIGSFLYGVFHAAGPGHGKVVLSTYLLAKPEAVSKSLWMAVGAAALQGVVAIVLVYGLFYLFGALPKTSRAAALWSERLSYVMVAGVGAWLLWRAVSLIRTEWKDNSVPADKHDHEHHHHHHHSGDHAEACSHCGHVHLPSASQTAAATDFRSALGVIFSIGLRPCSGAILVLVFAKFASIPWAGVMAVVAMSAGTAITVSSLALIAVKGRNLAQRLLVVGDGAAVWFAAFMAASGGIILILMGGGLFSGSFQTTTRSMGLG